MFRVYAEFHISHSMGLMVSQSVTALLTAVKGSRGTTGTVQNNPGFTPLLFVEQLLFGRNYSWSLKYLIEIVTVCPHYLGW